MNKRMCMFMALVVVGVLVLGGCVRYETGAKVFTDSTGIEWRVLAENEDGNLLLITEHVHGITQYNSANAYTFLGQSDRLRPALDEWFTDSLAPELKEAALEAQNVNNDVRSTAESEGIDFFGVAVHENEKAGWSVAGGKATQENPLFILSISEVNKYTRLGSLNMQGMAHIVEHDLYAPAAWWLRSPGSSVEAPVAIVSAGDTNSARITAAPATEKYGFRPALWIVRTPPGLTLLRRTVRRIH